MTKLPYILFVGAYKHQSRSSSMEFYLRALERDWRSLGGDSGVIYPCARLAAALSAGSILGKIAGAIDKLLIFPFYLKREIRRLHKIDRPFLVHVVDQAYANYSWHLQEVPHIITCHDLISLQASMGLVPERKESWQTRIYQFMLLQGLKRSHHLVAVSVATTEVVIRLTGRTKQDVTLIYNDLHYPFAPMPMPEATKRVCHLLKIQAPIKFLLHVGINIWYKNRIGVLRIFSELIRNHDHPNLLLVMVGQPLTFELETFIKTRNIAERVNVLTGIESEDLRALYTVSESLLFPSLYEGFGWPIVEALACGCPVITSNRAPMNEIGGSVAKYIPTEAPVVAAEIVDSFINNMPSDIKEHCISQARRFANRNMIRSYQKLYIKLINDYRKSPGGNL